MATILALQDLLFRPQTSPLKDKFCSPVLITWNACELPWENRVVEHPWHSQMPRLPRPSVTVLFAFCDLKRAANPFPGSSISMGFSRSSHGGKNPAPVDRGFIVPSLSHYLQCFTVPLLCLWGKCSLSVWPTIMVKCIMAMLIYLHVLGTSLLLSVHCQIVRGLERTCSNWFLVTKKRSPKTTCHQLSADVRFVRTWFPRLTWLMFWEHIKFICNT